MEKLFYLIISIIILIALVQFKSETSSESYCLQDSDCVAATCCHPDSCVNINYAPDCRGVFCTMECRGGTMDCGQGYCACVGNRCKAIIE